MNKVKTMLAAALAAGCALAQSDGAAVTQAAADPSTIHNAVAELSGVTIQAFAAEVIDAIAAKPQSPVTTVFDLVNASSNFLAESDESNLADVLVALISNVPFEALPEWTARMYASVQEATQGIEDASYNQLVVDVIGKIGDLDYTDEDKVVVTAFAIKLLSRGKDDFTDEPLKSALAAIPGEYQGQVAGSLGDVLGGDYSGVLAGVDITVVPEDAEPGQQGAGEGQQGEGAGEGQQGEGAGEGQQGEGAGEGQQGEGAGEGQQGEGAGEGQQGEGAGEGAGDTGDTGDQGGDIGDFSNGDNLVNKIPEEQPSTPERPPVAKPYAGQF